MKEMGIGQKTKQNKLQNNTENHQKKVLQQWAIIFNQSKGVQHPYKLPTKMTLSEIYHFAEINPEPEHLQITLYINNYEQRT